MISTAGIKSPIEKYVGNNIYNRMSFKLKKKRVLNPPEMWIRSDAVFESIVPAELFTRAHNIIRERSRNTAMTNCSANLAACWSAKGVSLVF